MSSENTLRTLKDLNLEPNEYSDAEYILKAEAIKRAKHHLERRDKFFELDGKDNKWFYWNGRLHEVMDFNNLSEEDLGGKGEK